MPTIFDYLNLPMSDSFQGKSFKHVIKVKADNIHEEAFSKINFHSVYEPVRAIRTERYKYICRYDERCIKTSSNTDGGLTKEFFLENGYKDLQVLSEELYNLYFDSNERKNLIIDPDYFNIYEDKKIRSNKFFIKTNDPILNGQIKAPKGASPQIN